MKIKIEHPAFLVARHKGGRVLKPTVIVREAEFELAVISSDQALLAFRVHQGKGNGKSETREIRAFDGRLYGSVQKPVYERGAHPQSLDEIVAMAARSFFSANGLFGGVVNQLRSAVLCADSGTEPSGIRSALHAFTVTTGLSQLHRPDRFDERALAEACKSMAAEIEMDDGAEAQVKLWHDLIQVELSRYLVVDGAAYVFCGEPVYRISDTVTAYYPDAPDGSLTSFSFTANQRDEAIAEARRQAELSCTRRGAEPRASICDVSIEVVDADCVTWRAEERDFDRYARSTESRLATSIARLADAHKHIRVPKSVYMTWLELRELVDGYGVGETLPEELETVLAAALDEWRSFHQSITRFQGVDYLYQIDEELNERMFTRYGERPISLAAGLAFTFKP
jgi:hypothetical protein|nr:hypothetical protein [Neorhizobium tomejilense]